jgi:RNA polymerase sigma-70 factor (ECF subfamily)
MGNVDSPHNPSKDDAALVKALQGGSEAAFTLVVRKYHRKLLTCARAIVGDVWAEEVVQDAWVSVYRSVHAFEGRSALQTWLFTIVRNEARTRLRKEHRHTTRPVASGAVGPWEQEYRFNEDGRWLEPPALWDTDSPEALLERRDLQDGIRRAMSALPADQQAVVMMRDLQQMNLEDICNILGVTNSNVRVLLHRGRLRLMRAIEKYQETGIVDMQEHR